MASSIWRGVLIVFVVLLLLVAVAGGVVLYVGFRAVKDVGEALSSDTTAKVQVKASGERLEFHLTYGKSVQNLSGFTVQDAEGNKLWRVEGHGQSKPPVVVYGELPPPPAADFEQKVPAGGAKPPDIRGKKVRLEIDVRFLVAFGAGHQTYREELEIPAAR